MKRTLLFLLLQYGFCIEIVLAQPNCITIVPWSNADDYMRNICPTTFPTPVTCSETWIVGGGASNCYAKYNFSTNTIDDAGGGNTGANDPSHWTYFCTCTVPEGVWFRRVVQRLSCAPNGDCDLQELNNALAITNSSSSASNWSNLTAWTLGQVPNLSSFHAIISKSMNLDVDLCVCSGNVFAIGNSSNFNINSGSTLTCNSTIKVISPSQLTNRGILKGIGKILGSLSNTGTFSPGNSAGTFTITGDYTAQSTAAHDMEIASTSSYDIITVSGAATLNGTLNVSLLNGFVPNIGDQFTLMNYGSKTGTFSTINLPTLPAGRFWHLTYNPTTIVLEVLSSALTVELTYFKGQNTEGGNLLTWQTANEINNKGFQVERIPQPPQGAFVAWEILGFVAPQPLKGAFRNYEFLDKSPLWGWGAYRLRQIDNDGKETLSKVISVARKGTNKLKVNPNPVSNMLLIETDFDLVRNETNTFQIFNLLGQQVRSGKKPPSGVWGLDVSALPQGTYFLKVGVEQVKFIKQ